MATPLSLPGVPPTTDTVDLLVKIDGQELDGATAASVLDVSVEQALDSPAHLTLRLAAWDPDSDQLTLDHDSRFDPGSTVEVELGFLGQRRPVFWGEIVGLELEASATERAIVTVNAYDLLHRLGRGERERPYEDKTYASIVREIAQIYHIAIDAPDVPGDPLNPIKRQKAKSDLKFLTELAKEIQHELFVDAGGKQLVFRKSQLDKPAALTLDARQDLVQFSARIDAAGQLGGVEVRAYDSDNNAPINASLRNPDTFDHRFGPPSCSLLTDVPLLTQDAAQAHGGAELLRIRTSYLTATGSCFGRTELRPGLVINIVELGKWFSGEFYVTRVTHSLSPSGGFRTSFQLEGVRR